MQIHPNLVRFLPAALRPVERPDWEPGDTYIALLHWKKKRGADASIYEEIRLPLLSIQRKAIGTMPAIAPGDRIVYKGEDSPHRF